MKITIVEGSISIIFILKALPLKKIIFCIFKFFSLQCSNLNELRFAIKKLIDLYKKEEKWI